MKQDAKNGSAAFLPGEKSRSIAVLRCKWFAVLAGFLAGLAVFLLLYGAMTLDVTNDAWILNGYDETDIQQHYAGWLLFRNSHWTFPLGYCDTLAVPDGTMITYTDSLPWVSVLFKALRGFLPSTFQWFGWYTLFCFMLQGAAGALLCGRICLWGKKPETQRTSSLAGAVFTALGGLAFCLSPVLWERAFRHVALASQYLWLFALYFFLEHRRAVRESPSGRCVGYPWKLTALAFLAVGIHPYFLPPVLLCALLAAVETARAGERPLTAAAGFGGSLLAAALGGVMLGAIGSGVSASRSGYGEISMNLNAPFDPAGGRGDYLWSRLLPVLAQHQGQYDGFNYLGAGVLLLLAVALAFCLAALFKASGRRSAALWWRRNWPLWCGCVLLALFAVSNNAWLGDRLLYSVTLPQWLLSLCGIFRSSGRMFWIVGGCITLFGLYTLWSAGNGKRLCAWVVCGALLAVTLLQSYDLSAVAQQKRQWFQRETDATVVNDPQTQNIGAGHTMLLCADVDLREDRLRLLALLAGKQGLATNLAIAVSGEYPGAAASVVQAAALLESGQYDSSAVYVTTDESQYLAWQKTFAKDANVSFFVASSCYFLLPTA